MGTLINSHLMGGLFLVSLFGLGCGGSRYNSLIWSGWRVSYRKGTSDIFFAGAAGIAIDVRAVGYWAGRVFWVTSFASYV